MVKINSKDYNIKIIAESGQCFRMQKTEDREWPWRLIALDKICFAKQLEAPEEGIALSCSREEYEAFWKEYFDDSTDYEAIRNSIDENDAFLTAAADYGVGIRILRQDPWEMLITFIISQQNNIPKITNTVRKICERWGSPIGDGIYAFPTPEQLSFASDEELRACSLGYRVPYIMEAAAGVLSGEINLEAWKTLDDEALMKELLKIKGVGIKVANCVALFGYHRVGAFPIDTWIRKVVDEHYGGEFPLAKYSGYAGILQQYMFYFARTKK